MKPPRPIGPRPVEDNGPYQRRTKTLPITCLKVILIYIHVRSAGGGLITIHYSL